MSWTYDPSDLDTSTDTGRVNTVRFLVGDTDENDQLLQDEEVSFSLNQSGDNVYYAASYCAAALSSKFTKKVNTKLDGALSADYSDLSEKYRNLSFQLKQDALSKSGTAFGVYAGGISISDVDTVRDNTDRITPAFRRDRFKNPPGYGNQADDYE